LSVAYPVAGGVFVDFLGSYHRKSQVKSAEVMASVSMFCRRLQRLRMRPSAA
jgi:hypothetical protein